MGIVKAKATSPHFIIMEINPKIITGRFKIGIEGLTEEEIFDALIQTFRDRWGKRFNLQIIGRKDIEEKHI